MSHPPSPTSAAQLPRVDRTLVVKALAGIAALVVLAALGGWLLREPVTRLSRDFVQTLGPPGIFGGVFLTEIVPLPWSHEPFTFFGLSGGVSYWAVVALASPASIVGGLVGYWMGRGLQRFAHLRERFEAYQPRFASWLHLNGPWCVALAALFPIPFNLMMWGAGVMQVPFGKVALATLLRIPKVALYTALMLAGWSLTN